MINSTVQELRNFLISGRDDLLACKPSSQPGRAWLEAHSALIDETLRRIYHEAWRAARAAQNTMPDGANEDSPEYSHLISHDHEPELALLAIGGYGRAELCPYSDIDIAFVPAEEENPLLDAVIKEAFRLVVEVLIDGAKLDVGYAYRPISDCVHLDHTGKAALLESRLIVGSERLHGRMREELRNRWDAVEFLLDKTEERRDLSRSIRLSLYAVEPNLKEGVGALREIQTALWAAGAMHASDDPMRDLEWRGVVTASDCNTAREANNFFLKLRVWLHLTTKKKTDVLTQELQNRCARDFGYTGSGTQVWQRLLRDYYRYAEGALRFSQKVMRRLLEGPLRLDDHFVAVHRRVRAAHPYVLRNHPELILTPFALARKYGFETDAELDRLVEESLLLMDRNVRAHPIMRASFLALLHDVDGAADALTDLRGRGVLQNFIPEFDAMLQMAPADPSHELTVGEHSIYAVRQLGDMWRRRNDDEFLYSVWDGVEDVELLVLTTLLHDVGKIQAGSDHSISGARLGRIIGERMGVSSERLDRLSVLIRRHLLLPRVARLRDLSAPGTIRDVLEHIGDVTTLKMLYLLSLADTRAVGERSYSSMEIEAMRDLYERTLMAMTRQETAQALTDSEMREQMIQRERARLRREMRHLELDEPLLQRLCDSLPASYVLNTPLPTIATHLKFLDQLPQEKVIVDFYQNPREPFTEMSVVAYDERQPGLLSKICGVVYAAGMDIHMAQVFTLCGQGGTCDPALVGRVLNVRQQQVPADSTSENENGTDAALALHVSNDLSLNGSATNGAVLPDAVPDGLPDAVSAAESQSTDPADKPGIVLDRLYVARDGRPLTSAQCARLAALLREVLLGEKSVEQVLEAAGKDVTTQLAPQRISVRNDLSDEHSVLTVVNDNVPGLLYYVTRALASLGLDIHSAKITSWAGRAEDAFYITRRNAPIGDAPIGGAPIGGVPGEGTFDGVALSTQNMGMPPARDQKISDDEIKVVLDEVQRRLQKPLPKTQASAS
ncbi:MAG TPA: HD domain-containing protein [Abditibacteriaceae bacterium]